MRTKRLSIGFSAVGVILAVVAFAHRFVPPRRQKSVLLNLNVSSGIGGNSLAGLIFDRAGNLYGATASGGSGNGGSVFELSPNGSGSWTVTLLHAFLSAPTDGDTPRGTLIIDAAGNLYGTTYYGGATNNGMVFELMPQSNGTWKEKQLHSFSGVNGDGATPQANLVLDSAGNIYGTTFYGGSSGGGIVFELSPTAVAATRKKFYMASSPTMSTATIPQA